MVVIPRSRNRSIVAVGALDNCNKSEREISSIFSVLESLTLVYFEIFMPNVKLTTVFLQASSANACLRKNLSS